MILVARNQEKLADVRKEINMTGGTAFDFSFDLEAIEDIPVLYESIMHEVKKNVTILINNVGYQVMGFVQNTPIDSYQKNYAVNTLAPIALIQSVLPGMLEQGKGLIANVYSSIMYHAFPGVSSYCASKKALGAMHESLKTELTGTPIKTLCIRPGSFQSDYWHNTEVQGRVRDFSPPSMKDSRDPAYVAAKICQTIECGKEELSLGTFKDKVGFHLSYWAPRFLDKIIVSRNSKLLTKRPYLRK